MLLLLWRHSERPLCTVTFSARCGCAAAHLFQSFNLPLSSLPVTPNAVAPEAIFNSSSFASLGVSSLKFMTISEKMFCTDSCMAIFGWHKAKSPENHNGQLRQVLCESKVYHNTGSNGCCLPFVIRYSGFCSFHEICVLFAFTETIFLAASAFIFLRRYARKILSERPAKESSKVVVKAKVHSAELPHGNINLSL